MALPLQSLSPRPDSAWHVEDDIVRGGNHDLKDAISRPGDGHYPGFAFHGRWQERLSKGISPASGRGRRYTRGWRRLASGLERSWPAISLPRLARCLRGRFV